MARLAPAVRLGWSAALLLTPDRMLSAVHGRPVPPAAVAVARVLGVRHLLQGAVTARSGSAAIVRLGTAADGLHIASCLLLAALSPRWRRVALAEAMVETGVAVVNVRRAPSARSR